MGIFSSKQEVKKDNKNIVTLKESLHHESSTSKGENNPKSIVSVKDVILSESSDKSFQQSLPRTVTNLENEVVLRFHGEIDGKQFQLKNLKNCDIYLLDKSAIVYVDFCENCRIFIGPVEGSVFIRNCKDIKAAVVSQQFRTRDCIDCEFALQVQTKPIIEASTNIIFSPYVYSYPLLKYHMLTSRHSVFINKWQEVYDFSKNEDNDHYKVKKTVSSNFFIKQKPASLLYMTLSIPITIDTEENLDKLICIFPIYKWQKQPWSPPNTLVEKKKIQLPVRDKRLYRMISFLETCTSNIFLSNNINYDDYVIVDNEPIIENQEVLNVDYIHDIEHVPNWRSHFKGLDAIPNIYIEKATETKIDSNKVNTFFSKTHHKQGYDILMERVNDQMTHLVVIHFKLNPMYAQQLIQDLNIVWGGEEKVCHDIMIYKKDEVELMESCINKFCSE